jgi:hypothetical protein
LQFRGAGMFEAEYLAALRIDPGHHMLVGQELRCEASSSSTDLEHA